MPTLLIPIRNNDAYIGLGKQTTGGTGAAPNVFPRWLDGSSIAIDLKAEEVREGDTSRRLSQIIKNLQMAKIKLVCYPRPVELGFLECAAMGAGSDTVTAATVNTTLSASAPVGSTSLSLTSNAGLTGTGTVYIIIAAGTGSEEILPITTPGTGIGPYVYNIPSTYNNGAGTITQHNAGVAVNTATTHTLIDQVDGSYYTVEVSLGGNLGGGIIRVRDCKVDQIKRSSKAGTLLKYEVDFVGLTSIVRTVTTTPTYEMHPPFLYTQGVWTINGVSGVGTDAVAVETFDFDQKNALDTSIQASQLVLEASIFGMLTVEATYTLIFTNPSRIYATYFGTSNAGANSTDAQSVGAGSLLLVFALPDNFHTVTYTIPSTRMTKTGLPTPKADGKHFTITATDINTTRSGANSYIMQTVVTNGQTTSY